MQIKNQSNTKYRNTKIKVGNAIIGKYFYDGEGKRAKKVTNLEETVFVYGGLGKLIAEYSTEPSQTPQTKYLTEDHLGTPRIITDASGQVTARRDFLPFGEDLPAGVGSRSTPLKYGATADDIRQKFTGYQKDKETSLDFAEARMYENRFGRFTAVDPLLASGKSVNPQSFNRYVYVQNSPLISTDPTGLCGGPNDPCPFNYQGQVWAKQINGNWHYNNVRPDKSWQRFRGEYTTFMRDCMCDTTFHTNGWYVKSPSTNDYMQNFIGGFNYGADNSITGLKKGGANIGIGFWNLITYPTALTIVNGGSNPFYIEPYKYDNLTQAKFGTGTEVGFMIGTVVAGGALSGGSQTSLNLVSRPNGVLVTEKGLSQVKSHLSQFGEYKPNTEMINRLENAMQKGQRVTGADRNFYFHELKESTLMNRGMSYQRAHPEALRWDNLSDFGVYHPEVIRANPRMFNDNWFNFWGITR